MLNIVNTWDYLCYVMDYVAFKDGRFCMRNKEWDGDVFLGSKNDEVSEY